VLFDMPFYAAMYRLKGQTKAQIRTNWVDYLKSNATYPNCRQGNSEFSTNLYLEQSKEIMLRVDKDCLKAVQSFLRVGMFEGDAGRTYHPIVDKHHDDAVGWVVEKTKDLGMTLNKFTNTYFLTMWLKMTAAGGLPAYRNIMHVGAEREVYPKSPAIFQYPSSLEEPSTRLQFVVSQTLDPDFSCDPKQQPNVGQWLFVGLAVEKEAVQVYYNGRLVCNKTSGGALGETLVPSEKDQFLWVSDPVHFHANARIFKMMYYPEMKNITEDMIGAMMDKYAPVGAQRYDGENVTDDPFGVTTTVDYPLGHLIPHPGLRARSKRISAQNEFAGGLKTEGKPA